MASARGRDITESDVRTRSYLIWEREGRPDGRQLDHWLKAQAELKAEAGSEASVQPVMLEKTTALVPETPVPAEVPAKLEAEFEVGAVAAEKPKKRTPKPKAMEVKPAPKLAKASRAARNVTTPRRPSGKGSKN